ncbi:MAG TPA: hypothetical protein VN682_06745 [Terriglobales bacterium]|jgi:hypothetical protein|nr:hypothetical protein [Terriglobales bacterium]
MRLARIIIAVAGSGWGCVSLIRSGLRPDIFDPPKWYDRTLRVIGGVILGFFCIGIIFMIATGKL